MVDLSPSQKCFYKRVEANSKELASIINEDPDLLLKVKEKKDNFLILDTFIHHIAIKQGFTKKPILANIVLDNLK